MPTAPAPPAPTYFAFPEGTFLFDDGKLELGIIRDSLWPEQVNHYELFAQAMSDRQRS